MATEVPAAPASRSGVPRRVWNALTRPLKLRASRGGRAGDYALAAAGIALGLTCAVFPWYIFLHQDQFGIRALKFSGGDMNSAAPVGMTPSGKALVNPMPAPDIPVVQLDLFATGTLPENEAGKRSPPGLAEQPFPARPVNFRLVHVANGRAMIEDQSGLWVVQRGSILPDNSKVTGMEMRDGQWVMLTTGDRVIELAR